jgi:hypothetical protein
LEIYNRNYIPRTSCDEGTEVDEAASGASLAKSIEAKGLVEDD